MSPLTMAMLAMLAYKALKGGGPFAQTRSAPAGVPSQFPQQQGGEGGGLSDLLRSGLGGLLGGGAAGSILTSGLGELLKGFQNNGQGDVARSWIGNGSNKPVDPNDLERAVGADTLDELAKHTGMGRDQVLQELSKYLPGTVDKLTPQGRIPAENEFSQL
jgi:uncharacterized protein YidB (DUF937 family)